MENLIPLSALLPDTLNFLQNIACFDQYNSTELIIDLFKSLNNDGLNNFQYNNQYQHQYSNLYNSNYHNDYLTNTYEYNPFSNNFFSNNKRNLQATAVVTDTTSVTFITDLTMVFVCVICAGLASGLTQVCAYAYLCVCMNACMCVHMRVCMHAVWVYICMWTC